MSKSLFQIYTDQFNICESDREEVLKSLKKIKNWRKIMAKSRYDSFYSANPNHWSHPAPWNAGR